MKTKDQFDELWNDDDVIWFLANHTLSLNKSDYSLNDLKKSKQLLK